MLECGRKGDGPGSEGRSPTETGNRHRQGFPWVPVPSLDPFCPLQGLSFSETPLASSLGLQEQEAEAQRGWRASRGYAA